MAGQDSKAAPSSVSARVRRRIEWSRMLSSTSPKVSVNGWQFTGAARVGQLSAGARRSPQNRSTLTVALPHPICFQQGDLKTVQPLRFQLGAISVTASGCCATHPNEFRAKKNWPQMNTDKHR